MNSFYSLNPERVMDAVDEFGFVPTGEFQQLNSYENRVFDIRLETDVPQNRGLSRVILKFYRPGRWSFEALSEEHGFLRELVSEHIRVAEPLIRRASGTSRQLKHVTGNTLLEFDGMWVAAFPKLLGRMPQELLPQDLFRLGIVLAQLHGVGGQQKAGARPILGEGILSGWEAVDYLQDYIAVEVRSRYNEAASEILSRLDASLDPGEYLRIHGDCHRGNILQMDENYALVDFDDFCMGPAVQDFWMLLSGDPETEGPELDHLIAGYEELREFPDHQWKMVPLLRGLRVILYGAWIARRWTDPSFPRIFPEFNTYRYWAEETEALEKIVRLPF